MQRSRATEHDNHTSGGQRVLMYWPYLLNT